MSELFFSLLLLICCVVVCGQSNEGLKGLPECESDLIDERPVLLGYDVVHYHLLMKDYDTSKPPFHTSAKGMRGDPKNAFNLHGFQFWFASKANLEIFESDPYRYAPRWGGHCGFGISSEDGPDDGGTWPWSATHLGPPAGVDDGWSIINGTLFFNIWDEFRDRFETNRRTMIPEGNRRWIRWFGSLHAVLGPFNTHCIGRGRAQNWCIDDREAWHPTCIPSNATRGDTPEGPVVYWQAAPTVVPDWLIPTVVTMSVLLLCGIAVVFCGTRKTAETDDDETDFRPTRRRQGRKISRKRHEIST